MGGGRGLCVRACVRGWVGGWVGGYVSKWNQGPLGVGKWGLLLLWHKGEKQGGGELAFSGMCHMLTTYCWHRWVQL